MALRDTWHRALVYFGLAEDEDADHEEEVEPEVELEETATANGPTSAPVLTPPPRRDPTTSSPRGEEPAPRAGNRTRAPRPVENGGRGGVQVHLVVPKNFNDAQQIADQFKDSIP